MFVCEAAADVYLAFVNMLMWQCELDLSLSVWRKLVGCLYLFMVYLTTLSGLDYTALNDSVGKRKRLANDTQESSSSLM
jgi:hypothetical protein